ncbi:MAG: hypothetical protein WBH28_14675 [Fuerstiella sp.]|jgi:hypothetical protein
MCDAEGEPLDEYVPGDFTDPGLVVRSVTELIAKTEQVDDSEFVEPDDKVSLIENWKSLLPALRKALEKKIRIVMQIG